MNDDMQEHPPEPGPISGPLEKKKKKSLHVPDRDLQGFAGPRVKPAKKKRGPIQDAPPAMSPDQASTRYGVQIGEVIKRTKIPHNTLRRWCMKRTELFEVMCRGTVAMRQNQGHLDTIIDTLLKLVDRVEALETEVKRPKVLKSE